MKTIGVENFKTIKFNEFIAEIKKGGDYMKRSLEQGFIIKLR